jgi:hypothetical protein
LALRHPLRLLPVLAGALVAQALSPAPSGAAKLYGTDRCVSDKLRATAELCEQVLGAHARFEEDGDQVRLDSVLAKGRLKLAKAWGRAQKRVAREVTCEDSTAPSADVARLVEDAAAGLADSLNAGLDLGDPAERRCGREMLEAARDACGGLLRSDALHLRKRSHDRLRLRLAADQADVMADLQSDAVEARNGCPTALTPDAVAGQLEALEADVVAAATVSPVVDDQSFTQIEPPEEVSYLGRKLRPICSTGTPWVFFAKRGTVNKVVMYYQGGGACWNPFTCNPATPTYDTAVTENDDPSDIDSGFGDLANPDNPFKDWSVVFIPYCTGDVHWGDASFVYSGGGLEFTIEHRGAVNARVAEKWARDHFVMPEEVFVTGSSAGAYGAIASSPYLMEFAWPSSHFAVLGDAGNGVITQDFLVNDIAKWGIERSVPRWIENLDVPITELSIVDVYTEVARHYPWNRFGTYTTSFDGPSGGQTGFYNIMRNGGNPVAALVWWEASCEWNAAMRAQNFETFARTPSNFRYYIGTGSRHTMWGNDKVYTDTTGGVPTVKDWIEAMLAGTPEWTNVECQDCGTTLPGDPKPGTLPTPPFDDLGNIVCPGVP